MSHRIACYTLFDITKTGILNRAKPGDDVTDINDWYKKRNTQCNFDTILQVISLRAQPDVVNEPKQKFLNSKDLHDFGYTYKFDKNIVCWTFDFEVQHPSVFEDGIQPLGHLYTDCNDVPMINSDQQPMKLSNHLEIDKATRNIYFVKY